MTKATPMPMMQPLVSHRSEKRENGEMQQDSLAVERGEATLACRALDRAVAIRASTRLGSVGFWDASWFRFGGQWKWYAWMLAI
ncbi:MAG: hypothetical protein QOG17_3132 [Gammaproteobacteria bacterium]|jgi:hypothetical protein|nr:hypothetical protein [Gammaproteobacteria bacterium]